LQLQLQLQLQVHENMFFNNACTQRRKGVTHESIFKQTIH
jgi:hypothetical protein